MSVHRLLFSGGLELSRDAKWEEQKPVNLQCLDSTFNMTLDTLSKGEKTTVDFYSFFKRGGVWTYFAFNIYKETRLNTVKQLSLMKYISEVLTCQYPI